jgi:hypothetical protein
MTRYSVLAQLVDVYNTCVMTSNLESRMKHGEALQEIMKSAPEGSGIDSGTKLDVSESTTKRLLFTFGFHHMDDDGFYTHWTHHTLKVTPDLAYGINLSISGRDRNQIKDQLYEIYGRWLHEEVPCAQPA